MSGRPDHFHLNAVPYQPYEGNMLIKGENVSDSCESQCCLRAGKTPLQHGGGHAAKVGRWIASSLVTITGDDSPMFQIPSTHLVERQAALADVQHGSKFAPTAKCPMTLLPLPKPSEGERLMASYPEPSVPIIRNQGLSAWQRNWES